MASATMQSLSDLYTEDETAWLEAMAALARQGDLAALDVGNLGEYLTDMAQRDRREVKSRLVVLLAHLLKWEFQAGRTHPQLANDHLGTTATLGRFGRSGCVAFSC